jgi:hypothetical protein
LIEFAPRIAGTAQPQPCPTHLPTHRRSTQEGPSLSLPRERNDPFPSFLFPLSHMSTFDYGSVFIHSLLSPSRGLTDCPYFFVCCFDGSA